MTHVCRCLVLVLVEDEVAIELGSKKSFRIYWRRHSHNRKPIYRSVLPKMIVTKT